MVVTYRSTKNHKDPFYLSLGFKEDILQILSFRLPANLRGLGLGSTICQTLIHWALVNEVKEISVTSRSEAIDFWIKNGFTQVSEKTLIFNVKARAEI